MVHLSFEARGSSTTKIYKSGAFWSYLNIYGVDSLHDYDAQPPVQGQVVI